MVPVALSEYIRTLLIHQPIITDAVLAQSLKEQGWEDAVIQEALQLFISGKKALTNSSTESNVTTPPVPPPFPTLPPELISHSSIVKEAVVTASPAKHLLPPELETGISAVNEVPKMIVPPQKTAVAPPIPTSPLPSKQPDQLKTDAPQHVSLWQRLMSFAKSTSPSVPAPAVSEGDRLADEVGITRPQRVMVMQKMQPVRKIEYVDPQVEASERENPSQIINEHYRIACSWGTYLYMVPLGSTIAASLWYGMWVTHKDLLMEGYAICRRIFDSLTPTSPTGPDVFSLVVSGALVLGSLTVILIVTLVGKRALRASGSPLLAFLFANALYVLIVAAVSALGVLPLKGMARTISPLVELAVDQVKILFPLIAAFAIVFLELALWRGFRGAHVVRNSVASGLFQLAVFCMGTIVALLAFNVPYMAALSFREPRLCTAVFASDIRAECIVRAQ